MKKSIFVLSALLTLVVSGICLQSCSSEYDEYTTEEEYGYYTEEETNAVKEMASKYGLSVVVNPDYYGVKRSLSDIEEEMKGLSSIVGKYDIVPMNVVGEKVVFTSVKRGQQRLVTRAIEGKGEWSGCYEKDIFVITVSISWDCHDNLQTQKASGEVSINYENGNLAHYEDYSFGSIQCSFQGNSGITFEGSVSYAQYNPNSSNDDQTDEKDSYILYSYSIIGGQVSVSPSTSGSFEVVGGLKH